MSASVRLLVLLFLGLPAAWAQISSGTIVGLVEDPSGAVIPNAEIAVKQIATGEVRTTHTNANGEFNVPFLQPGGYGVTASAGGFKSKNLSDISLRVDQTVNLHVRKCSIARITVCCLASRLGANLQWHHCRVSRGSQRRSHSEC